VDGNVTVTKAALIKLVDGVLYPNPDDPGDPGNPLGPYGPIGPLIRAVLRNFSSVMLNPQPLPPLPDPWRSAVVARTVVDQVVAQYRLAEVMGGSEQAERAIEVLRAQIGEFVDEYCGNGRPRRGPLPSPYPLGLDPEELTAMDLLAAGTQFQKAADSMADGSPLQEHFSAAADQLIETGMGRLESG
jgi:hypothetical protein